MPTLALTIADVRAQIAAARQDARAAASANDAASPDAASPAPAAASLAPDAAGHSATVALVPTMGALHAGHLALIARAREIADIVVVSIFVNPLQFNESEDLERYPRDVDADLATIDAAAAGADTIVFAPSAHEMYPDGKTQTKLSAGTVGTLLEGRSRAGHFDGVLVVVNKLLNIVHPTWCCSARRMPSRCSW